jgi:hypothetical protein
MSEKFEVKLDDSGNIHLKIGEGEDHIISRTIANSLRYELFQAIGKKAQWHMIHDFEPEEVGEMQLVSVLVNHRPSQQQELRLSITKSTLGILFVTMIVTLPRKALHPCTMLSRKS